MGQLTEEKAKVRERKPRKIAASSMRQFAKIKSAGSRATSAAAVSGRKLIRPIDHLLKVSRFARITFITGFVLVTLVLTTLVGFHLSRILWSEDKGGQDRAAGSLLPIETETFSSDVAEFKPSGAEAGQLSSLRLLDSNNRPFDFATLEGRVIVVNFWATWCAPCIAELPKLAQLSSVWKNRGVEFIAVSVDEGGWERVNPFLQEHRIKFLTVMVDQDLTATQSFHIRGLPTTVFFDRQGRDIGRIAGEYDWLSSSAMNLLQKLSQ